MSQHQLTKQEAFELISSVIDGEVDQEMRKAFFRYIKNDAYIRKQYRSAKQIKELLATRCPSAKAPTHLKYRIREALAAEQSTQRESPPEELVYDIPCKRTPCSYTPDSTADIPLTEVQPFQQTWMYLGATVFLITILFWGLVLVTQSSPSSPSVEEFASQYYAEYEGGFIPPTISASSMMNTEMASTANVDLSFAVPSLKGAQFQGFIYTDISSEFKAPLLEYYISEEDRYVYVFAFDIDMLENNNWLSRHEETVNQCSSMGDFHIQQVNGNHVVSWKWNNTWYTAISDQDGESLASRIQY